MVCPQARQPLNPNGKSLTFDGLEGSTGYLTLLRRIVGGGGRTEEGTENGLLEGDGGGDERLDEYCCKVVSARDWF